MNRLQLHITIILLFLSFNLLRAQTGPYQHIAFVTPPQHGKLTENTVKIFNRVLSERTGHNFSVPSGNRLTINLVLDKKSLPAEAYRIGRLQDHQLTVTAGDENGILYGLGKLLHTATFSAAEFVPGTWEGTSQPDKSFRAIYFATHFFNFYQSAPIEKVTSYLEELALWGYNGLVVWFDMHQFNGITDPKAVAMLDRLALILKSGTAVGMKSGLTMLANEGYKNSPLQLRANPKTSSGYHYHREICPALPGGTELILEQVDQELDEFIKRGVQIDRIGLWPYDQGGCGCNYCSPWGSNGYLKITSRLAQLFKKKIPQAELIMSTWLFDFEERNLGEWEGLAKAFAREKPWVDYIMADSHTEFPGYLLKNPVPGNLPLLNFPEISMWGNWPWGGYGANPFPQRLQQLWNQVADKVSGGYPYSEGIFEDANKIVYSQFYWDSKRSSTDIMKEYVSFEFSAAYADQVMEAIGIMEKNYGLSSQNWAQVPGSKPVIVINEKDFGAKKAYELLKNVDKKLAKETKTSWRWRLLLLRTLLDKELRATGGVPNKAANAAFDELCNIQYLHNAYMSVKPPLNSGEAYQKKTDQQKKDSQF